MYYGNTPGSDDHLFYRTCEECKAVEWKNEIYCEHVYDTTYSYDSEYHWFACEKCETKSEYEKHIIDDSGYCTVCDKPVASTKGVEYKISQDGTYATVVGYSGTSNRVVIADTFEGVPVTAIGSSAFSNCDSLTSVLIPDSVTSIGYYAFEYCDSLTSVVIPDSV